MEGSILANHALILSCSHSLLEDQLEATPSLDLLEAVSQELLETLIHFELTTLGLASQATKLVLTVVSSNQVEVCFDHSQALIQPLEATLTLDSQWVVHTI